MARAVHHFTATWRAARRIFMLQPSRLRMRIITRCYSRGKRHHCVAAGVRIGFARRRAIIAWQICLSRRGISAWRCCWFRARRHSRIARNVCVRWRVAVMPRLGGCRNLNIMRITHFVRKRASITACPARRNDAHRLWRHCVCCSVCCFALHVWRILRALAARAQTHHCAQRRVCSSFSLPYASAHAAITHAAILRSARAHRRFLALL